jgi:hypothetical protein
MKLLTKTANHLALARHLVGKYSRPNKFIVWYCDKRKLRGAWLTAPWCAMYQSFVAHEAGVGEEVGEFASCPAWVSWFKKQNRWSKNPAVGAMVFYDWDHDGEADHVGLVSAIGADTIKSVEGNTTVSGTPNWVHEQTRKKSTVLGYGYPKYLTVDKTYFVKKGDTLSSIAALYGTTWQKVWAENKATIVKPSLITPGQKLVIP